MAVTFGQGFIVVSSRWSGFKAMLAAKELLLQFAEETDYYSLFALDGGVAYSTEIWKQNFQPSADYTEEQNAAALAEFEGGYKARANRPMEVRLEDGRIRQATEKSTQSRLTLYSHDWTDPTTWYSTATYVAGETATDSGDHQAYSLAHVKVIDSYHGKMTGEDALRDAQGRSFRVSVYVNGTKKTEQDPHSASGGDYTINYAAGTIHFLSANQPSDVVTVDYHHMVDSHFIISPTPGKNLRIDFAEVQFSTDVVITDSVVFQPYGLVDVFAPQLMPGVPSGTKIPLGDPLVYKGIKDFQNDAVRSYPAYPALGGSGWRGMTQPIVVFDWDYQAATVLVGAAQMEIHLFLEHDTPLEGTYATATFYCLSEDP